MPMGLAIKLPPNPAQSEKLHAILYPIHQADGKGRRRGLREKGGGRWEIPPKTGESMTDQLAGELSAGPVGAIINGIFSLFQPGLDGGQGVQVDEIHRFAVAVQQGLGVWGPVLRRLAAQEGAQPFIISRWRVVRTL